jgi:hypothetical protein
LGIKVIDLKNAVLTDVDHGYCDECDKYEIVNTYQMPIICCHICKDKRGREVKSICGSCLALVLTNGE